MLPFIRVDHYRPTTVNDDEGGATETLGAATELWGVFPVHGVEQVFICRTDEDVKPEDRIMADTAQYRVIGRRGHLQSPFTDYDVERVKRPIVTA